MTKPTLEELVRNASVQQARLVDFTRDGKPVLEIPDYESAIFLHAIRSDPTNTEQYKYIKSVYQRRNLSLLSVNQITYTIELERTAVDRRGRTIAHAHLAVGKSASSGAGNEYNVLQYLQGLVRKNFLALLVAFTREYNPLVADMDNRVEIEVYPPSKKMILYAPEKYSKHLGFFEMVCYSFDGNLTEDNEGERIFRVKMFGINKIDEVFSYGVANFVPDDRFEKR